MLGPSIGFTVQIFYPCIVLSCHAVANSTDSATSNLYPDLASKILLVQI